ncbi:hypothetical protein SLS60_008832 [Paraconiothyrium brasiliense]|uniref:Tetratricopeptide repeat protein n=1 Tax=Paraconiothyrium brasiliense TaxID=300254 RepID=A0ABR3QYK8_9PLEO
MAHKHLLGIPIELRERIYKSLLTHNPTSSSTLAPASPICALLTLNHQIHAEIISFLQSQLLVLLKTNDKDFISKTLDTTWDSTAKPLMSQLHSGDLTIIKSAAGSHIAISKMTDTPRESIAMPFVSQLRSRDLTIQKNASKAPIAMELEFYILMPNKEPDSYAAFLIPASSLKTMVGAQNSRTFYPCIREALLSVNLLETFSHTRNEAQKLLLRPYIDGFQRPIFWSIKTQGVDAEMAKLLRRKLQGNHVDIGRIHKLQKIMGAANGAEEADVDRGAAAARRFRMAIRYAELLWENHQECLASPPFDGIHQLWLMHSDLYANHVQLMLNAAAGTPSNEASANARTAAEQAIEFLGPRPRWGRPETARTERALTAVRKSKAELSLIAHKACKGMGDVDAAMGYLREALKYEPEASEMLLEQITQLKDEGAGYGENIQGVIKWE